LAAALSFRPRHPPYQSLKRPPPSRSLPCGVGARADGQILDVYADELAEWLSASATYRACHWLKIQPKDGHFDETAGLPGWMGGDGRETSADEM
jgi:hypothetical protein